MWTTISKTIDWIEIIKFQQSFFETLLELVIFTCIHYMLISYQFCDLYDPFGSTQLHAHANTLLRLGN